MNIEVLIKYTNNFQKTKEHSINQNTHLPQKECISKWPTPYVSRGRQTKYKESPSVLTELGAVASNLSMGSQ